MNKEDKEAYDVRQRQKLNNLTLLYELLDDNTKYEKNLYSWEIIFDKECPELLIKSTAPTGTLFGIETLVTVVNNHELSIMVRVNYEDPIINKAIAVIY